MLMRSKGVFGDDRCVIFQFLLSKWHSRGLKCKLSSCSSQHPCIKSALTWNIPRLVGQQAVLQIYWNCSPQQLGWNEIINGQINESGTITHRPHDPMRWTLLRLRLPHVHPQMLTIARCDY